MLDPVQRRQYGVTALLLSVVFVSVSIAAGVGNMMRRDGVVDQVTASSQACESRLKLLGATNVALSEERVMAEWAGLDGGYTAIGDASAAAMACPGWVMRSFCMGQECSNAGVKLELGRAG